MTGGLGMKKNKTHEDYERESRRNSAVVGILMIILGVAIPAAFIATDGGSVESITAAVIMAVIFVGFGVFMLCRGRLAEKAEKQLEDENSPLSQKEKAKIEKKMNAIGLKMHNHKGLREEVFVGSIMTASIFLAVCVIITVVMWFAGVIYFVMLAFDLVAVGYFIYAAGGFGYKKALAAYASPLGAAHIGGIGGLDKDQADADFEKGALLKITGSMLCLGPKCILGLNALDYYALAREYTEWVFLRRKIVYHYTNGVYSGKENKCFAVFCMSDGAVYEFECGEAAGMLVITEMQKLCPDIITGWSDELGAVYGRAPHCFREKAAEMVRPDPFAVQK